jgi:hypothetical protein
LVVEMGDRVSVSFVNEHGEDESVALFDHWGGREFADLASKYALENKQEDEPCFMMVEFIRSLPKDRLVYLGKNSKNGDNSDNGHFQINIKTGVATEYVDRTPRSEPEKSVIMHGLVVVAYQTVLKGKLELERVQRQLEKELKAAEAEVK